MKNSKCFVFSAIASTILGLVILATSQRGVKKDYPIRYQPELDYVTMDKYINNKKLFDIQVKCLLYDGPCDIVGRFIKPRLVAGLLGICIKCTPHQAAEANKFLIWINNNRPDLFKLAVQKYLEENGITPPKEFKPVTISNSTDLFP